MKIEGKRFTKVKVESKTLDELSGVPFPAVTSKIEHSVKIAKSILEAKGLPTEAKITWKQDGREWHGFLDGYIETFCHRDTPEWYAARIIVTYHRLKRATGQKAVEYAYILGQLTANARAYQYLYGETASGGKNSHGLSAQERQERNEAMQAEIDRLCLERGLSYKTACHRVSLNISSIFPYQETIHPDTVRKNTESPY